MRPSSTITRRITTRRPRRSNRLSRSTPTMRITTSSLASCATARSVRRTPPPPPPPNNADSHIILGELRNRQKRPADAVAALQRAMALQQQAGKPVDQQLANRALAFAYNNRLPASRELAMQQLRAEPAAKTRRERAHHLRVAT